MAKRSYNQKNVLIASLISLFFSQTLCLFSQRDYIFREYGVQDGLPQSQASIVLQDSRGFLWICTRNGLSRYDGIDFVNYFRKDGLPSNLINNVFEDQNGQIWVSSREGLSRFTGDSFVFYPPDDELGRKVYFFKGMPSMHQGRYLLLSSTKSGNAFRLMQFEKGVYLDYSSYYPALDTLKIMEAFYDSSASEILLINYAGILYSWDEKNLQKIDNRHVDGLHYDRGKILLHSKETIFEYRDHKIFPHSIVNNSGRIGVKTDYSSPRNRIYFFDGAELNSLDLPFVINGRFIDNNGTLWLSSENNIFRLQNPAFTVLNTDIIKSKNLWAICLDRDNKLWLGSLYGDLYKMEGASLKQITGFWNIINSPDGFYKGSRLLSNGELWFSTNTCVIIWDGRSFRKLGGIPDSQVCYIYEDPDNHKIFIGTEKGLFIKDGETITLNPVFNDDALGVVEGMVKDDSGFYWISGHRGVLRFDGKDAVRVIESELPGSFTYNIEKDSRNGIWVSSEEGLFCKRQSDNSFRAGIPPALNRPANTLKVIDSTWLLVGRSEDVCLINLEKFYNGDKNYFRIYDQTDGYPGGESLDNGIVKDKDGSLWILTSENVIRFDPAKLKHDTIPPMVMITGISYETDSLTWEPVMSKEFYYGSPDGVVLKRKSHKIKIMYTGISTTNSERVSYVSVLKGLENKWSLPTTSREKVYDHLEPGNYTFMLKAINADGVQTESPVILNFRIKKSIWETTLFKILYVVVAVFISVMVTWFVIKYRQKQKEEKQKINSQLQTLQISSVLNQFDPHFTFNAISSIGYLIMKNSREEAYNYLTRLSSLLRTVLYDGSLIIRSVQDELDFVTNYCELQKLRFGDKFEYYISIGENVDVHKEIPKMSIQTFVENSLKHGFGNRKRGGKIEIDLSKEKEHLKIVVRDNGIGREESARLKTGGSGHGIKTVRKIFEIMNQYNSGKASVEINDIRKDDIPAGTEVVVRIPEIYTFSTE